MTEISSKKELGDFMESKKDRIIYIGLEYCSVCVDLYPKIEKLLEGYPKLELFKIEYSNFPELKGIFSIYTVPAILGYIEEKEFLREARFISVEDIKNKIDRYYQFL